MTRSASVNTDQMEIAELKAELERLHSASFGWALSCCRRDRTEAEEVLQTVYLKILEGKARFSGESSLREAADVMGVSIGSARQHYERGKKRLRESLATMELGYGLNWGREENPSAV